MGICEEIRARLFVLQDEKYRDFHAKLIPNVPYDTIIGVRTPMLKKFANEIADDKYIDEFLSDLPHKFYDETNLHGLILCRIRDYDRCVSELERLLPFIDNWAGCDLLRPRCFRNNFERLLADIERWLGSDKTYTVRFALEMLMTHFLDENFKTEYLEKAVITSDEYYINMMSAWFFATALAKQYGAALPYLEQRRLSAWVHNKTIQKALESYRISPEKKEYLRNLKLK